jgi:DNA-binding MarR family transcriptional regulator
VPHAEDRAGAAGRDHVSDDDARTANLLGALAYAVTERTDAALRHDAPVAGTDAMALVALRNYADGAPLETLRDALGLSQPGTVRLVDRLVARGLVARGAAPHDRRARAVRLTAAGRHAAEVALAARATVTSDALEVLGAAERRRLAVLLERLLAGQTTDRTSARRICRLCDGDVCGHPGRCPVTQAVPA